MQKLISDTILTLFCIFMFAWGIGGFLALANRHEPVSERISGLVIGTFLCGGALAMFFLLILN